MLALAACLILPSLEQVYKFLGLPGTVAYMLFTSLSIVIVYKYVLPRFISYVTEKQVLALAFATFLLLILAFALVYPIADAGIGGIRGRVSGGGSDRDNALNLAATELMHGRYLYTPKTYLGNRIGVLPGGVILSAPFVLLGNSAYQNLFWILVLFIVLKMYLKDGRLALIGMWGILFLSPVALQQLVTGGDLLSNVIYVLVFSLILTSVTAKTDTNVWIKIGAAILLGIGLSSRANFILVLPLAFSFMAQNIGWKEAAKYTGLVAVTAASVTLPFYFYNPDGFTPLFSQSVKVSLLPILPSAGILVPILGGLLALALMFQRMGSDGVVFWRNCAIGQFILYAFVSILPMIEKGGLVIGVHGYGMIFFLFGAIASWLYLTRQASVESLKSPT